MPILIGLGLALLCAAPLLYEGVQTNRRLAQTIARTRLVSCAELLASLQAGTVARQRMAAVRGAIVCAQPLIAPRSGAACVAYRYTYTRYYEADGEDGPHVTSETLKQEERRTAFEVRDATGEVTVQPEGAELDLTSAETREPGLAMYTGARDQTLYYIHHEEVLPVGSEVYVLGLAASDAGAVRLGQPREWPSPFVVSRQASHQLLTIAVDNVISRRAWAAICAALGLGLLLTGLLWPH